MKNTTFRKKALLSSVAMLLVAIVALGSATFAWFTTNPTVTADGLSLQATAAAGLQIVAAKEAALKKTADEDNVFATSTKLEASAIGTTNPDGVTLDTPVSLDGTAWRTVAAKSEDSYAWNEKTAEIATGTPHSEVIYLRSSIADAEEDVVIQSATVAIAQSTKNDKATKMYNALRVTLIDQDNTVIGTWAPVARTNAVLTASGPSGSVTTLASGSKSTGWTKTVGYVADADYNTANYVTMYVWLDGEDEVCKTANVENLKQLVEKITITFTTAA